MPYCVTVKHGDIERHDRFIDALNDVIECAEERAPGLFIWWEPDDPDHDTEDDHAWGIVSGIEPTWHLRERTTP